MTAARRLRSHALPGAAARAGVIIRGLLAVVLAVRGLAGVLLVAYGAWLAYEPAGFIVAGVLVLADRLIDERPPREEPRP